MEKKKNLSANFKEKKKRIKNGRKKGREGKRKGGSLGPGNILSMSDHGQVMCLRCSVCLMG